MYADSRELPVSENFTFVVLDENKMPIRVYANASHLTWFKLTSGLTTVTFGNPIFLDKGFLNFQLSSLKR